MKKMLLVLSATLVTITTAHAAPEGKRPDFSALCQAKALNAKVIAQHGDRKMEGTCQMAFKASNPNALERGAMRDPALQKACQSKAKGTAVTVKVDGKSVAGKCDIAFRPKMKP